MRERLVDTGDVGFKEEVDVGQLVAVSGMRYVSVPVILVIGAVGLAACVAVSVFVQAPLETVFTIYGCIAGPILIASLVSRWSELRISPLRSLTFKADQLTWSDGTEVETCSLQQCCWHLGPASDDSSLVNVPIRQRVILVVLPSDRVVACGFDERSHARWRELLNSAGCRRVLPTSGTVGMIAWPFVLVVGLGGAVGDAYVGWTAATFIQKLLIPNAVNAWWIRTLRAFVATCLGWCGFRLIRVIPGVARGTDEDQTRQKYAVSRFALKIAFPVGMLACGNRESAFIFAAMFAALAIGSPYIRRRYLSSRL